MPQNLYQKTCALEPDPSELMDIIGDIWVCLVLLAVHRNSFFIKYLILDIEIRIFHIIPKKNTIYKEKGGDFMPKFVARKPEKEVISMRISVDMLKEIDEKAAMVDISRNELMNQMLAYALANMDDTPQQS